MSLLCNWDDLSDSDIGSVNSFKPRIYVAINAPPRTLLIPKLEDITSGFHTVAYDELWLYTDLDAIPPWTL